MFDICLIILYAVLWSIEKVSTCQFIANNTNQVNQNAMSPLDEVLRYDSIDLDLWDDKDIAMLFVPRKPLLFAKLSNALKGDRELAMEVLQNDGAPLGRFGPTRYGAML